MLPARGVMLSFLALAARVVAWQRGRDLQDLTWVPLYALLVPIVAMLIVAEIALPDGRLRTALAMPGLRWLGRISYILYLWQQLFFGPGARSEEHTSELQSLMRISYAVFCLKKKTAHIKDYILITP